MPRRVETVIGQIDAEPAAACTELAAEQSEPIGEVVHRCAEQKRRRQFESEARRQSLEAAAAAAQSQSDEAAVMRELDAALSEAGDEWR